MVVLLSLVVIFFGAFFLIGFVISAPRYRGPVSDHFDGKKFINPGHVQAKGFGDVFKWMVKRKRGPWSEGRKVVVGGKPVPKVEKGVRITFVNHSTFLIQLDGLNILTDPVWSRRTSPVEWAGPERKRPPGIRFEDLPQIDLILLSHNHWDHLDIKTVKKIFNLYHPKIVTSLGVSAFLNRKGINGTTDLDWWQTERINTSLEVQAVPAQHFSGRGTFDRDATLWSGFVIKRPGGNIYFVGDTGYNDTTFKEIGERCSPISVAFVPIGAYKPEWFMSPIHCSPEEAVKIHQDVRAQLSIADHFGTFALADDGEDEPLTGLVSALTAAKVSRDSFIVLEEGKPKDF
jgi:L-ascorbate metabolism protein UlaG (beta-lactamase superfamily)